MKSEEGEDFTFPHSPAAGRRGSDLEGEPDESVTIEADEPGLPVGTRLREFEILGIVGEGGFSIVYEAWDHSLRRKVALKEYIPTALARRSGSLQVTVRSQRDREIFELGLRSFVNEARLLATFDHPALVKVHQFWNEGGTAYIVMPLYRGITLKRLLAGGSPGSPEVNERWLKDFLKPVFDALSVIHAQRCYHRDIAPDNILILDDGGKPLLLDFGAARQVVGDRTQDLTVILKNGYAPIEQYGQIPGMKQGPWTDIYALGAVVHFAIRGKVPPPAVGRMAKDAYEPLAANVKDGYSRRFLLAVDHALAVKPEQRPQSIEGFREEMGLDEVAVPGKTVKTGISRPTSRRALYATVGASIGLVGVIGFAAWHALAPGLHTASQPPDGRGAASNQPGMGTLAVHRGGDPDVATSSISPPPVATTAASGLPLRDSSAMVDRPEVSALDRQRDVESAAAAKLQQDLQRLEQLSGAEKRDSKAVVIEVESLQSEAAGARQSGDYLKAASLDEQADGVAKAAFEKLTAELVDGYSRVARRATEIGNFKVAQEALDRAKEIQALQRK